MTTTERIADALVRDAGYVPLENTELEASGLVSRDSYAFVASNLRAYAGSVGPVKLGGFGLLAILAEAPTAERFRSWVASLKRGSAWRKDYCVVWLLDQSAREVFPHRGFPLRFYPGAEFAGVSSRTRGA